jgi:nucleoside-diphosphate-sugar epimerase
MEDKPDKAVLIVGCGYIGQRVGRLLQAENYRVTGYVRSTESAAAVSATGIKAVQVDLDSQLPGNSVSGFNEIFYFAPPPSEGNTDTRMAAFLRALDGKGLRRIVYISTSAVYGDCKGGWITESQPLQPLTGRGRRRLDAEQQLRAWCEDNEVQWTVLRVPGIYGPGKLPLARLEKGLPVLQEADSPYTNRIHGDDLAAICIAAMHSESSNTVFNVSDGHPSNMTDYFFRVADAAGLPRPPTVTREEAESVLSPGMLSFLNDSRRMDNAKMLRELDVVLQYPDLAAGLKSCFTG